MTPEPKDAGQQKKWDEMYVTKDFFGTQPSDLALDAMDLFHERATRNVLELGCGQGRDTWFFVKKGLKVIAIDYSATGICELRDHAASSELRDQIVLKTHDIREGIPLPDNFVDAVFSHMFFCMELTVKEIHS